MTEYPYYWIVTHRAGEVDGAGASRCKAFLDRVRPTWTAGRSFIVTTLRMSQLLPFGELGGFPAGPRVVCVVCQAGLGRRARWGR